MIQFTSRPLTSAEADEQKALYEAAITAAEYPNLVIKKTPYTVYFTPAIPTELDGEYESGSPDKKYHMALICQQVLQEAPDDYNTRYVQLYNEAYP